MPAHFGFDDRKELAQATAKGELRRLAGSGGAVAVRIPVTAGFARGGEDVQVFGGGGGVIVPAEIRERVRNENLNYPDDMVTDVPEAFWVAELVREQLLAVTHDELPHSIATRVVEWEWPRIRVEILVERDSQKGMVIE